MPDPQLAQDSDLLPHTRQKASATLILTSLALALLGFVLAATLLHLTLGDPLTLHAEPRSEKLLLLHTLTPAATAAAFGSSHIHNGFDPQSFDHAFPNTHSLNLAVYGGSQAEQRVMALEFLHQLKPNPQSPCLVLLELTAGANFTNDHLVHPRAINLYDLPTATWVSHLTDSQMSHTQRLGRAAYAYTAAAMHYLSVGMLSSRIFVPQIDQQILTAQSRDDRRGLQVEQPTPRSQAFIQNILAHAPAHPQIEQGTLTPGNSELIVQLAAATRLPVSFAYIIYPKYSDLTTTTLYPDSLTVGTRQIPIINLARPDLYPALYKPILWFDDAHFDQAGAVQGTRLLAEQLKLWHTRQGQPAPCGGPR